MPARSRAVACTNTSGPPLSGAMKPNPEVLEISGEQGFALWLGVGNIMRGWAVSALGQTEEAISLLLRGLTICRDQGCNIIATFWLTTLAAVYGKSAQPDTLAEAAKLIEVTQERWAEAEMHRVRGMLLLSTNDHLGVEDSYRQSLTVARHQSAIFWELRAASSLARLWRDQSRRTEARDLLAPIYNWFTEGFDTPVLKEAKGLLEQLSA
jgi:predicted ATPase